MTEQLQPDVDEVLQAEPAGTEPTVKVAQQGPTRTQILPRKAGTTFTKTLSTTPTRLVGANHRRAVVKIMSDANLFIAFSRAGIMSAFETPDNHDAFRYIASAASTPVLEVAAAVEVWAAAVTATAKVSAITELWATGEGAE